MMKKAGRFLTVLIPLVIFLMTPERALPSDDRRRIGDKVLLSLKIAGARKETHRIEYYKSITRQRKHPRPVTASPPSSVR
jgi:hypothetical protein